MIFNDDSSDGCEFQLTKNHVKENDAGTLVCAEDYFDLNKDLSNDDSSDGCEFRLSPVNIDKNRPQTEGSWNCLDGYADIDEDPYNGCEINGWTDNMHCGAGGISKQNPIEGEECKPGHVCTGGECKVSCGKDYILVCVDQCSNTKIDKDHCGECNIKCEINEDNKVSHAAVACQGGGCHAIACQPGYYLAAGENKDKEGNNIQTCKPCADGKYTTSATATVEECIDCPETTGVASMVFDADENICKATSCLAGYVLNDGSCKPCEAGTYSKTSDTAQCKDCYTICATCPDGEFSGNAASGCTKCPAGTIPNSDKTSCINCLAGEYSDEGSNTCSDCTGDTISAAGSAMCAECKGNTHANYDHTACVGCNAASDCVLTTGVESIQCSKSNICEVTKCKAGYELNDGQCEPCEAGTYSNAGATSCSACGDGQFSGNAASSCTKCPAGTYTTDHVQCTNCPAGKYSNEGSKECTSCTGDKISAAGSATCAECKGNTHANSNHTACVGCNDASDCTTLTTGAQTMQCGSQNICKAASCLPGYKLVNNEKCEPCPAGSISTSDNKCTQCLAGTYAEDNECKQCPAGSYCPTAGLTSPIDCPKGHYCTAGVTEPTACPAGSYLNATGATNGTNCVECPKGTFNPIKGAEICAVIPAGFRSVNDRAQYYLCSTDQDCKDEYNNNSTCYTNGSCVKDNNPFVLSCATAYSNENFHGCPGVETWKCENNACTCKNNKTNCSGKCVDTKTDNDHCGGCNKPCGSGKTCKGGTCK